MLIEEFFLSLQRERESEIGDPPRFSIFFDAKTKDMSEKDIIEKMEGTVLSRGCFLVDVTVTPDNDITICIESEEGSVQMEDCIEIDRVFHILYNQDAEDYSLTVTSAGLDQPFKVLKQYTKAIGTEVEVKLKGGRKLIGTLDDATDTAITLSYTQKETVPGKKKKETVSHTDTFPLTEVNSTVPHITFE